MDDSISNKKKQNKVMTEQEAVSRFLKDGNIFTVGGFLTNRESDCVFREIARQGQKNLHYAEESATFGIDILIGLGVIDRFDQAYIANRQLGAITGMANLERCLKEGIPRPVDMGGYLKTEEYAGSEKWIKVVDWSNFMLTLRFVAGALNVPYIPCRSGIGSDILKYNTELIVQNDPFENKPLVLVPALKPDVAFISVQRADRRGNGQVFGHKGVDEWKARSAKHVVLFTEEIVDTEVIMETPANTIVPEYCTDAVVYLPYNSHPHGVLGCYGVDRLALIQQTLARQTQKGFEAWMDEWVFGCKDHSAYCEKMGWEKLEVLKQHEHSLNKIPRKAQ